MFRLVLTRLRFDICFLKSVSERLGLLSNLNFFFGGSEDADSVGVSASESFRFLPFVGASQTKAGGVANGTIERPQAPGFKPRGNRGNSNISMGPQSLKFKEVKAPEIEFDFAFGLVAGKTWSWLCMKTTTGPTNCVLS